MIKETITSVTGLPGVTVALYRMSRLGTGVTFPIAFDTALATVIPDGLAPDYGAIVSDVSGNTYFNVDETYGPYIIHEVFNGHHSYSILQTSGGGSGGTPSLFLGEFQVGLAAGSGTDNARGKVPTAFIFSGGAPTSTGALSNVTDGDDTTFWQSNAAGGVGLSFDLGAAKVVAAIRLKQTLQYVPGLNSISIWYADTPQTTAPFLGGGGTWHWAFPPGNLDVSYLVDETFITYITSAHRYWFIEIQVLGQSTVTPQWQVYTLELWDGWTATTQTFKRGWEAGYQGSLIYDSARVLKVGEVDTFNSKVYFSGGLQAYLGQQSGTLFQGANSNINAMDDIASGFSPPAGGGRDTLSFYLDSRDRAIYINGSAPAGAGAKAVDYLVIDDGTSTTAGIQFRISSNGAVHPGHGAGAVLGGFGAPTLAGVQGDFYIRVDNTGPNDRFYDNVLGVWTARVLSSALTNYSAGVDQTTSRALNTDYVNGTKRRTVSVSVTCTSTATAAATAGRKTTVGGTAFNRTDEVGLPSGVAESSTFQITMLVDPGATYRINSAVGAGASVTLKYWDEVDL